MSNGDLYSKYIYDFYSNFQKDIKTAKDNPVFLTYFILSKDFIDFPEKRGSTNKNILKKINNGVFMLDPDKSFYVLDYSTWSKIKKEYPDELEVNVKGKFCNFKFFFEIMDLYYFYFINDNNILIEGYMIFKNKEFSDEIIQMFSEFKIDNFFKEMKIQKTYDTQKINYKNQFFSLKFKKKQIMNKIFKISKRINETIEKNDNKMVNKNNIPIDIKIYSFFKYYFYFKKKFKSLLNELQTSNYKTLKVILISIKWLDEMKDKYNYNLVKNELKDKEEDEINFDFIVKLARKYPLNPQLQDYIPKKQQVKYYLDTKLYYFINYTFIDRKCLGIFKEEIDKENLEFKERSLFLIKNNIYVLVYYPDVLEVLMDNGPTKIEKLLFLLNNKSITEYIINLFISKKYENVFKELNIINKYIDEQKIFDKEKNEIGTMINLLNINNKKDKHNFSKNEVKISFIRESSVKNNSPEEKSKIRNKRVIERKNDKNFNTVQNFLKPPEEINKKKEIKKINNNLSKKRFKTNNNAGNNFKKINPVIPKKNNVEKEKIENEKININKKPKENPRHHLRIMESQNINIHDNTIENKNIICNRGLIGKNEINENKIETNPNISNIKNNEIIGNKRNMLIQRNNTHINKTIKEKEYLRYAHGLVNSQNNTCLNSILECLAHVYNLTDYLLNSIRNEKLKLAKEYINILNNIWFNDKIENYSSNDINNILNEKIEWKKTRNLNSIIIILIETLHNELNKANKDNEENNAPIGAEYDFQLTFDLFFKNFTKNYKSKISDIFYGMFNYKTLCLKCNCLKHDIQCFNFLEFSLEKVKAFKNKNENIVSINDCFDYYQKEDFLDSENSIYCNRCKNNSNSKNSYELLICPKSLIICLNRVDDNFDIKLYFEEFLDIKKYVNYYQESPSYYELIGIVCNCDFSKENDYFISFCKSFKDFNWYKYDNENVNLSSFQEASSTGIPYILFYSYIIR